jgi:hypothetical protein
MKTVIQMESVQYLKVRGSFSPSREHASMYRKSITSFCPLLICSFTLNDWSLRNRMSCCQPFALYAVRQESYLRDPATTSTPGRTLALTDPPLRRIIAIIYRAMWKRKQRPSLKHPERVPLLLRRRLQPISGICRPQHKTPRL